MAFILAAAATADDKESYDDEPDPVVVKKSAKAIRIHNVILREMNR